MSKDGVKSQESRVESRDIYPLSLIPHPSPNAFSLSGVSFAYEGSASALKEISLSIAQGEKVVLLGANGSGKSTLLKILNGLLLPTAGSFQAFGKEITERTLREEKTAFRFRQQVGFIFQNSDAQLFSPTVRDEIAFGPLQMEFSRQEVAQRIADVAAMLDITPLLDRPPFRLSGGEKKKVAIASVLVMNPEAILLDEPTTGLDPRSQCWLADLLVTLNEAGKTLVTATHDLTLVSHISDRAIVMDETHRIARVGATQEILADTALLSRVNLIHEHYHWHGSLYHSHPHHHDHDHEHNHEKGIRE